MLPNFANLRYTEFLLMLISLYSEFFGYIRLYSALILFSWLPDQKLVSGEDIAV
jgi:hypothetical protein